MQESENFNLCLVEVLPDGQIIFADNYDRAYDWLALDTISFNTLGQGEIMNIELDSNKFKGNDDKPLRVVSTGPLVRIQNADVEIIPDVDFASEGVDTLLKLPADTLPPRPVIPVAFSIKDSRSISLSHVSYHKFDGENGAKFSDTAGYTVEGNIVHLYGQIVSSKSHFSSKCCLLVLPSNIRPATCCDFLVCGVRSGDDESLSGVLLRLYANGCLLFVGTSLDSPSKYISTLSLDGIRFLVAKPDESVAHTSELMLGSDVAYYPLLNDHSRKKTLPNSVLEMLKECSGNSDKEEKETSSTISDSNDSTVNMEDLLEDAAAGGYTQCQCDAYPCNHVITAASKGRKEKRKATKSQAGSSEEEEKGEEEERIDGTVDFGKAGVMQQHFGTYLFGQVFKRLNSGLASKSEGYWAPGIVI